MANMIQYFRKTAFLGLLIAALASCNDHDLPFVGGGTGVDNNSGIPGLKPDILGLFAYNGGTEVESNVWQENLTMGLFLTKDSLDNPYENDRNTYFNIKCVYSKEGWKTDPKEIKLSDRPAVIYAYSPYIEKVDPLHVPVECESGRYYMYGTHLEPQTSVRKNDNVAKVLLKQVQALVDFRMKKKDWDGEVVLQQLVIRRKGFDLTDSLSVAKGLVADSTNALPIAGEMDIQHGTLVNTTWGQYSSKKIAGVVTEDFTTSARIVLPVMPMAIGKDMVEIVFTVNGFQRSVTLRGDQSWKAGTRNIINLTFTGEGFEIEESIKPWQDIEQDIIVNA